MVTRRASTSALLGLLMACGSSASTDAPAVDTVSDFGAEGADVGLPLADVLAAAEVVEVADALVSVEDALVGDDTSDTPAPDAASPADAEVDLDIPTITDTSSPADVPAGPPDSWVTPDVAGLPNAAVRGRVWIFGPPGGPLVGAKVAMLEHPDRETVSDDSGAFEFLDVPAGDVTLVMTANGYHPNQLGTHTLLGVDADHFDFQAVSDGIYALFASLTEVDPDPAFCQVSTTVTRYFEGGLPGVHGEPGVVANIEPSLSAKHGPIYFSHEVLPTPGLTETTVDGGVVWMNVPPGDYVLHAKKDGVTFEDVRVHCRPGVLVNAGPPRGLQALNVGSGY